MTTFRTAWSEEDQEFVGLCDDYPSLSWLDPDQDAALSGIKSLVREIEYNKLLKLFERAMEIVRFSADGCCYAMSRKFKGGTCAEENGTGYDCTKCLARELCIEVDGKEPR